MAEKPDVIYADIFDPRTQGLGPGELRKIRKLNEERKPLYLAVRQILQDQFRFRRLVDDGGGGPGPIPPEPVNFPGDLDATAKTAFVSIYGLMLAGQYVDPTLGLDSDPGPGDLLIRNPPADLIGAAGGAGNGAADLHGEEEAGGFNGNGHGNGNGNGAGFPMHGRRRFTGDFRAARRFVDAVVDAVKEYNANAALFMEVLKVIIDESRFDENELPMVRARQVAEVARRLIEKRIEAANPQLRRMIKDSLSLALGGELEGRASSIDIDLPDLDLDSGTTSDILADNVFALSAIYFAAMLEEMRYFTVADFVSEQFMNGMLPLSRGPGGQNLFDYIKNAEERFTEVERRSLYARAFGLAQGSVEVDAPNREFSDLWIRFLSAVSLFGRQSSQEKLLVHPQQVHKNGRDLTVNLSLHGYAVSHFFAVELQRLVRDVGEMLSHPEVINAYGVRNQWQLVDRVSQLYLGGAVNTVRYRTMAQAGAKIIQWLAQHSPELASPFTSRESELFTDPALLDYAERWLAVTGTPDSTVEQYSEPILTPTQSTIPSLSLASVPETLQSALDQFNAIGTPATPAIPQA